MSLNIHSLKAFLFDLDGCIYFGNNPAPGSKELLDTLQRDGIRTFFLTNNSTHRSAEVALRLRTMGLPAEAEQVITATECCGTYIREKYGIQSVKVIGSESLRASVEAAGHRVLADASETPASLILIGRDVHFTYDKLQWMAEEAMHGAKVLSANPDAFHLGSRGEVVPETGAIAAALEMILGRRIEYVGKPGPYLFEYVMRTYGLSKQQCVMVGDNPMTDIAGGLAAGVHTIWVKGEENRFVLDDSTALLQPDFTVSGMRQLLQLYESARII